MVSGFSREDTHLFLDLAVGFSTGRKSGTTSLSSSSSSAGASSSSHSRSAPSPVVVDFDNGLVLSRGFLTEVLELLHPELVKKASLKVAEGKSSLPEDGRPHKELQKAEDEQIEEKENGQEEKEEENQQRLPRGGGASSKSSSSSQRAVSCFQLARALPSSSPPPSSCCPHANMFSFFSPHGRSGVGLSV